MYGLLPGVGKEPAGSLWTSAKGRSGQGDVTIVVVCSGLHDQEEQVGEALCREEKPHVHRPWYPHGGLQTTPAGLWLS